MKIGILGTRGIPNNHGGFEQFAENLSVFLVEKGIETTVYNSHNHPYKGGFFKGVKILRCHDPEYRIGTVGQFIYDYNCIIDARKRKFDILLQLGYTSSSIWAKLLPRKSIVITNMDGLEWKRTKYSKNVQSFLKSAEKWAVKSSDFLISDSIGIQKYLKKKYGVESRYIAYGAKIFTNPTIITITDFSLQKYSYSLLIARLEPENNIDFIIKGYLNSKIDQSQPLVIIGDWSLTKFGIQLYSKFSDQRNILFFGGIYDMEKLNNLRFYSKFYFHGHSVGGTNPSLLEAMGSSSLIIAHDNVFNKSILGKHAFYFAEELEITHILDSNIEKENHPFLKQNIEKIKKNFNWDIINNKYLKTFLEVSKPH